MNGLCLTPLWRLSIDVRRVRLRFYGKQQPKKKKGGHPGGPPGWGEQIWLFCHTQRNHVLYSHKPKMTTTLLKQIPFNGKKMHPITIRKDLWEVMAVINFSVGRGIVGRSVFQKLREFRRRHELEWGPRMEELRTLIHEDEENTKIPEDGRQRAKHRKRRLGEALNDQKGTAVADVANVLSGAGKANLVKYKKLLEEDGTAMEEKKVLKLKGKDQRGLSFREELHPVTIYWQNTRDMHYAEKWPENVKHILGLPPLVNNINDLPEEKSLKVEDEAEPQFKSTASEELEGTATKQLEENSLKETRKEGQST